MEVSITFLLALSAAPGLYLLWWFYKKDRYEPEPMGLVTKAFLWGAVMVLPAAFFESLFGVGPLLGVAPLLGAAGAVPVFVASFLIIGPVEEYFKRKAVLDKVFESPEFNEVMDGIVYCTAAALGFATLENLFYVLGAETGGQAVGVGLARAVLSVPGHAFMGAVMGYWVGRAKMEPELRDSHLRTGWLVASALHGVYDFVILVQPNPVLLLVFLYIFMSSLFGYVKQVIERAEGESPFRAELGLAPKPAGRAKPARPEERRAPAARHAPPRRAPGPARAKAPAPLAPPAAPLREGAGPSTDGYGDPLFCSHCGRSIERDREYVVCDACRSSVCVDCAAHEGGRDLCAACAAEPAACSECRRSIASEREYLVCDWCQRPLCQRCARSDGRADLCPSCAASLGFAAQG